MYCTQLILPEMHSYQQDRTIPGSDKPFVAQHTDAYQECVYTIMCAKLSEVDDLIKEVQASEWKYDVNAQIAPMQEGIDRFAGTISCRRLLSLATSGVLNVNAGQSGVASYTVTLK